MDEGGPPSAHWGLRVTGRVQGVGFRWWTRRIAGELGLAGWVRNRVDGSVEVSVKGPLHALRMFEERLRRGPPGARVEDVRRMEPSSPIPGGEFVIRG